MIHNNPIRYLITVFVFFGLVILPMNFVQSHSGGLDRNGCHAGSEPYHCHRSENSGSSKSSDSGLLIAGEIVVVGVIAWLLYTM